MTSKRKPCINLYEPESVSPEGSESRSAAGVATENRLSGGVHPKAV